MRETQYKYLSKRRLKEDRGWTDAMVKQFLPQPCRTTPKPHYNGTAEMCLYNLERVAAAEFADRMAAADRRRQAFRTADQYEAQPAAEAAVAVRLAVPDPLDEPATWKRPKRSAERYIGRVDGEWCGQIARDEASGRWRVRAVDTREHPLFDDLAEAKRYAEETARPHIRAARRRAERREATAEARFRAWEDRRDREADLEAERRPDDRPDVIPFPSRRD